MLKTLEQIVKINVHFTGTCDSTGFDDKGGITIPKSFINTFKERQKRVTEKQIIIYCMLHWNEDPKHIELTDFFPDGERIDFWAYERLNTDGSGRILIPNYDLIRASMQKADKIIFAGFGDKILIYEHEDFSKAYQK